MPTLALKYRVYPTHAQETTLNQTLALCCEVYNSMLHWRKHDYEVHAKSPNYHTQKRALPLWKHNHPGLSIDVGLEKFATLSNGETVENPRFFRKEEKALAKAQRKFDKVKHQHRSKARRKAKQVVARVHERVRNRRHDFVHQTARRIVNRFGFIAIEDLHVSNMVANRCLSKSISDASWSLFRAVLARKAESADRLLIAVNPAYTSQDCSECGVRVPKTLRERVHTCPCCRLVLDRDVNAARNILKLAMGLHSLGERP